LWRILAFFTCEAEGLSGIIAHQGLPKARDDLSVDLIFVACEGVDRMDHETVLGFHHRLDEHRHEEMFMGNTSGLAA